MPEQLPGVDTGSPPEESNLNNQNNNEPQSVPYERFKQVNDDLLETRERVNELQGRFESLAATATQKIQELMVAREPQTSRNYDELINNEDLNKYEKQMLREMKDLRIEIAKQKTDAQQREQTAALQKQGQDLYSRFEQKVGDAMKVFKDVGYSNEDIEFIREDYLNHVVKKTDERVKGKLPITPKNIDDMIDRYHRYRTKSIDIVKQKTQADILKTQGGDKTPIKNIPGTAPIDTGHKPATSIEEADERLLTGYYIKGG